MCVCVCGCVSGGGVIVHARACVSIEGGEEGGKGGGQSEGGGGGGGGRVGIEGH